MSLVKLEAAVQGVKAKDPPLHGVLQPLLTVLTAAAASHDSCLSCLAHTKAGVMCWLAAAQPRRFMDPQWPGFQWQTPDELEVDMRGTVSWPSGSKGVTIKVAEVKSAKQDLDYGVEQLAVRLDALGVAVAALLQHAYTIAVPSITKVGWLFVYQRALPMSADEYEEELQPQAAEQGIELHVTDFTL